MPKTAPKAARRIVHSNVIGIQAGQRVERLAADVQRIGDHVGVPAHEEAADAAQDARRQDDARVGLVEADRLGQPMDRERREGVDSV